MQINSMVHKQFAHQNLSDQQTVSFLSEQLEMKQAIRDWGHGLCFMGGVLEFISMVIALQTGK
jgi:hypothetical protein